jgi:hypothetical protein
MKPIKLKTLAKLLEEDWSPETLATAIEKCGVWGWDRFGRLTFFKSNEPGAAEAIQLLEAEANHEADPQEESPFEESERRRDRRYREHGWKPDDLPDFATIRRDQPAGQRPESIEKTYQTDLAIIGALLSVIKGDPPFQKHPEFQSEAKLILVLEHQFSGYPGCKRRTLEKRFKAAKDLLKSF